MKKASNPFKNRITAVFFFFLLLVVIVLGRVFQLQVLNNSYFKDQANKQQLVEAIIPSSRASILDRYGNPLAVSADVISVWVDGEHGANASLIPKVSKILGLRQSTIRKRLKKKKGWLARKIFASQVKALKKLGIKGAVYLTESRRFYPKRTLAGQLLGFLGVDNSGLGGVEYYYDKRLRNKSKKLLFLRDGKSKRAFLEETGSTQKGKDLVLSIDEQIQYTAEKTLALGCYKSKAKRGIAIVSNPKTGEILAMANYPYFNPNTFKRYNGSERKNRAVTDSFEPGSTLKIFLAAAALEEGLYSLNTVIDCSGGAIKVGNMTFHDHKAYKSLTFAQVIEVSSNVGAIKIGQQIGSKRLYGYYSKFGFGRRTKLGLPGEGAGKLKNLEHWKPSSIGAISMGQEMSVTAIQLAAALNTVANGGVFLNPKIVLDAVRSRYDKPEQMPDGLRVISKRTCNRLKKALVMVTENGTGVSAKVAGYSVAGKTGTAQKFDTKKGTYSKKNYIASFIGFLPAYDPKVSIVVIVDEPRTEIWGGSVAAPIFKDIGEWLMKYMKVPPGSSE